MKKSELRQIIKEEIQRFFLKENLGLPNGTKVLFVNNKGKLTPGEITDEVYYDQYVILDKTDGHTTVLKKGRKAKAGAYFQLAETRLKSEEIGKLLKENNMDRFTSELVDAAAMFTSDDMSWLKDYSHDSQSAAKLVQRIVDENIPKKYHTKFLNYAKESAKRLGIHI